MLTQSQADEIRARLTQQNAWVDSIRGKNGWASYKPEDKPEDVPEVTNEERSALELFDFTNDKPDKYFAYVNESTKTMTTWVGDVLGLISFGREYRDNFGGTRVPVWIQAINGKRYSGTYFKSAGAYCRVKATKS